MCPILNVKGSPHQVNRQNRDALSENVKKCDNQSGKTWSSNIGIEGNSRGPS